MVTSASVSSDDDRIYGLSYQEALESIEEDLPRFGHQCTHMMAVEVDSATYDYGHLSLFTTCPTPESTKQVKIKFKATKVSAQFKEDVRRVVTAAGCVITQEQWIVDREV